MSKPRLLDLFCGAGGAARGYQLAGFHVTGLDNRPQPHYAGDDFVQADALKFELHQFSGFDAVHASPPCQAYSKTRRIMEGKGIPNRRAVDLVEKVRTLLVASGLPYVLENVVGAPLLSPLFLCGTMFGLGVYRHRLFESNVGMLGFWHENHEGSTGSHRGYSKGFPYVTVGGHNYNVAQGKVAMGIDWMTRDELNEAVPPAYTEFVGGQLIRSLDVPA